MSFSFNMKCPKCNNNVTTLWQYGVCQDCNLRYDQKTLHHYEYDIEDFIIRIDEWEESTGIMQVSIRAEPYPVIEYVLDHQIDESPEFAGDGTAAGFKAKFMQSQLYKDLAAGNITREVERARTLVSLQGRIYNLTIEKIKLYILMS